MESTEYILRIRIPSDSTFAIQRLEETLTHVAKLYRGKLSRIEREEHGTHATHLRRKTLVR